jgi:hypothetical protein
MNGQGVGRSISFGYGKRPASNREDQRPAANHLTKNFAMGMDSCRALLLFAGVSGVANNRPLRLDRPAGAEMNGCLHVSDDYGSLL